MTNETTNPYRAVLEDLAKSRGLSGAEELAHRAAGVDPDYTPEMILEASYGGFGPALDEALGGTTEEERDLISESVWETYIRVPASTRVEALRRTVFGRVLCELVEARGIPAAPAEIRALAERAGLDGWKVINRMASTDAEDPGHLDGLADALELSEEEKTELALAYSLERRAEEAEREEAADDPEIVEHHKERARRGY